MLIIRFPAAYLHLHLQENNILYVSWIRLI